MVYTEYDPGDRQQVRERDLAALESVEAATEELREAMRRIPNSVHTGFELPLDVQEIHRCIRALQTLVVLVAERHRSQDPTVT